jgi:hypothetical protein
MFRAVLVLLTFFPLFAFLDQCPQVEIEASLLLWQSKEGGLEFASKALSPLSTFDEHLYTPDFAWKPGLQVKLVGYLPYDNWDVASRYTFYHGTFTSLKKHFGSKIAPLGMGVIPLWHYPFIDLSPDSPLRFGSSSGNWKLFFNSIDFELGRAFFFFPTLPIRIETGAKISWIRQFYHAEYLDGNRVSGTLETPPATPLEFQKSSIWFASHAFGIGPRGGFDSKWDLYGGWRLIADAALSLLYTFTNLTTKYEDQVLNVGLEEILPYFMRMKEEVHELVPVLEARLGFDWGCAFSLRGKPFYFGATIAYEVQYWWAQNHARRNFPQSAPGNQWDSRGDLQMQGLNASLRWDF